MIVRLSHAQWASIKSRIPNDVAEYMGTHRSAVGKSHDYSMPAIGWKRALDSLVENAYGVHGGKMAGAASLYKGISRIAKAVSGMETHPAFTPGLGVMGIRNELVPCWLRMGWNSAKRSPYPEEGAEFMVLGPQWIKRAGHDITIWKPTSSTDGHPSDVSLDPAEHLRLRSSVEL